MTYDPATADRVRAILSSWVSRGPDFVATLR